MRWPDSSRARRALLAFIPALIAGLPLLSRAQGSAPPPTSSATQRATITLPAPADSARAALTSQIDRQLKEMADSLKLTPEQRAKARPILLDQAHQVKQLRDKYATREKTPAVMDAMKKEMQVLRDTTDARLAQVLTADQMAQYRKKRDEGLIRARAKPGITGMPGAPAADSAGKR